MHPSKSMVDYMSEMNRLFPRSSENNDLQTSRNSSIQSPFNQSMMANRSSSSADSTSPESFPDITLPFTQLDYNRQGSRPILESPRPTFKYPRPNSDFSGPKYESPKPNFDSSKPDFDFLRPSFDSQKPIYETPKTLLDTVRRQRPIVGRKILSNPVSEMTLENPKEAFQFAEMADQEETFSSIWQLEDAFQFQQTPPRVNNVFMDNNNSQHIFYELFPAENKGYEFKNSIDSSPQTVTSLSPNLSISPNSLANLSPVQPSFSPNFRAPPFTSMKSQTFGPSSSRYNEDGQKMCTFCRKNGETPVVYLTHTVKERVGNRFIVTCPILRSHVCSTCGVSGDNAHTITYCPILRNHNNGVPLQSTTITLKNTRIKSNGRRRF